MGTLLVLSTLVTLLVAVLSAESDTPAGLLPRMPLVLAGMALFGPVTVTAAGVGGVAGAFVQLGAAPLTLTAAAVGATWLLTARRASRPTTVRDRWRDAAITGAVLGVAGALVSALAGSTYVVDAGIVTVGVVVAVGPAMTLVGGLVVGLVGAALGHATDGRRLDATRLGIHVPADVAHALANVTAGGLVAGVLVAVAAVLVAVVEAGVAGGVAAALTVLPNAVVGALALGSFGGITASGTASGDASTETVTLLSVGTPAVLWLAVGVVVLAVLVAAVRGALAPRARPWSSAWAAPAVLAGLTLVAMAATRISLTGTGDLPLVGTTSGRGSAHLSWLTVLAAVAWGLVVEAAERVLAPHVVVAVPALARLRARRVAAGSTEQSAAASHPTSAVATTPDGVVTAATAAPDPLAAPTTGASDPVAPPSAADRRRSVLVTVGVLGTIVLVAGAFGVRALVQNLLFGPERPVLEYVAAVERGDVTGAFAVADPDLPRAARTLLTDDLYTDVAGRPTGGEVVSTTRFQDSASVTVASKQDGSKVLQNFTVQKRGKVFGVFDKWVLLEPVVPSFPAASVLPQEIDLLLVNGTEVPRGDGTVRVMPGTYTVALPVGPDQEGLVTSTEMSLTVLADGEVINHFADHDVLYYELADAARDEAEADAVAWFTEECLAATTLTVKECGLHVYEWRDTANVRWASEGEPTATGALDRLTGVRVELTGTVSVTYDTLPSTYREPEVGVTGEDTYALWMIHTMRDGELVRDRISRNAWD